MNRNYMVIHPEKEWNDKYTVRMISGNAIPGLLKFYDKQIDGRIMFYYDITSRQPLSRIVEHRGLTAQELQTLISDFICMLKQLERFLLDERQLNITPEHIYVQPDTFHSCFCLVPGKRKDFSEEFCVLTQYLLDHVDQRDGDAVILAFSIFRECRKENFGIDDIERCLAENVRKKEGKAPITHEFPEKETPDCFEESKNSDDEEMLRGNNTSGILKALVFLLITIMAEVPFGMYLAFGIRGMSLYLKGLLAVEMILGSGLIMVVKMLNGVGNPSAEVLRAENEEEESEPWESYFRGDGSIVDKDSKEPEGRDFSAKYIPTFADTEEDDMQTILLTASTITQGNRRLVPIDGGEEIQIGYYPFLIGKNKGISDYCLNEPGVSKLHVKIEKVKNGYQVTDLNSTNGTMVNGDLLEANETREIRIGDEIAIAGVRFRFV